MAETTWGVISLSGQPWGRIRKLVLDPTTREIAWADVERISGQRLRVAWQCFRCEGDQLWLDLPEEELITAPFGGASDLRQVSRESRPDERPACSGGTSVG